MKGNKHGYCWTDKMEKYSKGKKKAGEIATVGGHPLTPGNISEAWLRMGWVEEARQ